MPTDGQQPGDGQQPPEMPTDGQMPSDGQQPPEMPTDGQHPTDGQQPPEMPTDGQHPTDGQQPPEMPTDGQQPGDGQQPPEMPADGQMPASGQRTGLIDELLSAGVITQEEYDAISAAMPADSQMPGMPGEGQNGQMPGMPGDNTSAEYSAAATVTENVDGATYTSSTDSENAVLVSGDAVEVTHATITKTGSSSGESADFNGVNAAVLAKEGAILSISDTTVTTDGTHANGVFSYGSGTTVNVSNTTITTTGNNSGGLMTTGGATMNADNLTVSTSGNSSAAIRSDRGGGTVNVTSGTYDTTGVGSPAIYSTADITVSDATLSATNSEAVVIEGGNSVTLNDVDITGSNATLNGQSTQKTNVLIYQSMSGDASEGSSSFTMTGGAMTAETGSMFHVTNVTTTITLENVDFTYAEDSSVFLDASADSWGSSGKNGGNVTLNLVDQAITGAITSDSVSSVTVNLDSGSTWTLTGDSYVTAFNGDLSNVDLNGYTLYVNGVAVN